MHTSCAVDQGAAGSEVYHMTLRTRFLFRVLTGSALLAGALFTMNRSLAPAQQPKPKGQERLTFEEREYKRSEVKAIFQGGATDKKAIDAAAKYYAYRLTHPELQTKKGGMQGIVTEAISELEANRRTEERTNAEAIQYFNQMLLTRLKEVLPNPRPIASMNAARILVKMASLGQEEVTDALADALKDPDMNDATKFYAARGLKEFFNLAFPPPDGQPIYFKDREREARCIQALLANLDHKMPEVPPPTADEIEGLRILRREMIRALALSRYPAAVDAKGTVQGRTALALLRIIRNDNVKPPPRLDEQVEAAIGLALLKTKPHRDYTLANEYQLDVVAYHLGRFFVDLARRHQNRKAEEKTPEQQRWHTYGARLGVALNALKKDAKLQHDNDPKKYKETFDYVTKIVDLSLPIMKAFEATDGSAQSDQLAAFLDSKPKDSEPVYKGDKEAVVKPGTSTLTTEPKEDKTADEEKK
jgi:hypothetical protein